MRQCVRKKQSQCSIKNKSLRTSQLRSLALKFRQMAIILKSLSTTRVCNEPTGWHCISIRGVNRSKKRTSENVTLRFGPWWVIQYFFWMVSGPDISYSKFHAFFDPMSLWRQKSVNDIAMRISLWTPVTVREHLLCREHDFNEMSNDKYLDNFGTPKHLGYFWTTFLVSIGVRFRRDMKNIRILTINFYRWYTQATGKNQHKLGMLPAKYTVRRSI